jgi:23S rRNA pseudouridine1911/1915/1917 synthase
VGEAGAFLFLPGSPTVPPAPHTGPTILAWLIDHYPTAKRQTLRRMLEAGRVRVNEDVVRRASHPVGPDDRVCIADREPARRLSPGRRPQSLSVVYEDADVLVVDKPTGLLTSTNARERRPTLLAQVRDYVERGLPGRPHAARVGLIHRLDRDASGLLVFSKTHDAYLSLKRQLHEHSVQRVYVALVEGTPTPRQGRIQSRLVERADGTVYSTRRPGEGERAVTDYETVESRAGRSLVRVTLHTGRKHQIRVHLSERGVPIVGDTMYGGRDGARNPKRPVPDRLMLVAVKLVFTHPRTGKRLTFERPLPNQFTDVMATDFSGGPRPAEPMKGKA